MVRLFCLLKITSVGRVSSRETEPMILTLRVKMNPNGITVKGAYSSTLIESK